MAMSEEQRRKIGERTKARWAAKRAEQESQNQNPQNKTFTNADLGYGTPLDETPELLDIQQPGTEPVQEPEWPAPEESAPVQPRRGETIDNSDYVDLQRQILELKAYLFDQSSKNQQSQGPTVQNGQLTGRVEKYPISSEIYPDPRDRLKEEPRLQRFAFKMNYDLNYEIQVAKYETAEHIRFQEPRFHLELVRLVIDEETGEATPGRYVLCKLMMHEDPDAALAIAEQEGIKLDDTDQKWFLDELRYLRYKEWLLDCFYPPRPAPESQRKDMVINNRLVQYYEVGAENGSDAKIDFSKLPRVKF